MKNKILGLVLTLVVALSSCFFAFNTTFTSKADSLDDADRYFIDFVLSGTDYEGDLTFNHSPLYDENLTAHGREYIFTKGTVSGYALLIELVGEGQTFYEIEELYFSATSPFNNCVGLPVYISHNIYIDYIDGDFYNIKTNEIISSDALTQIVQTGFNYNVDSISRDFVTRLETINYATKATTENYTIQFELPNYFGSTGSSSCANTAGAVAIGYYDRFYENLIPNYIAYDLIGPVVIYKSIGGTILDLVDTLSELMLIGAPHEGTTFAEFEHGMNLYVQGQGYTYTSTSVFLNGSFNIDRYKNAVHNNKPVAIFTLDFAMYNGIVESEGSDEISSSYCNVGHVMVGCGYRVDTYYDANGNIITKRTYLKVASGLFDYGIAYLNINGITDIRNAISINIS